MRPLFAGSCHCAVALLILGTACFGDSVDVSVRYDHCYFVSFSNLGVTNWQTAEQWVPHEEVAWPRWTFWYQIEKDGARLADLTSEVSMSITTDMPIAMDIWHKPEIVGAFPTYVWPAVPANSDLTFTMAARATSSPGVSFARHAEPEAVPPGVSSVRIFTNLTVTSQPTVNGIAVSARGFYAQVFCHAWKTEWLRILSCEVVWSESHLAWGPLEVNPSRYSGNGFYARLQYAGVPVGESFPLVLDVRVENLANESLYVRPVVECNWDVSSAEDRGPEAAEVVGRDVRFKIPGPNGEVLDTRIYSSTEGVLHTTYGVMDYHGTIWAYWPQVVELCSALDDLHDGR